MTLLQWLVSVLALLFMAGTALLYIAFQEKLQRKESGA